MMMTTQDVPSCKLCTEHLIELYGKALELAKTLFPAAQKLLQNEKSPVRSLTAHLTADFNFLPKYPPCRNQNVLHGGHFYFPGFTL